MRLRPAVAALALTLASLGSAAGVAAPSRAIAATAPPVKIMPLGASITYGTSSSDGNGYREELRKHLVNDAGVTVDYVGSVKSGTASDNDNEGHSGLRIDQIAASVDGWLRTYSPDVVLINVGTNDMGQNYQVGTAPDRLAALVDRILAERPGVAVVFSTLLPSADAGTNSRVNAFNAKLPAIAQARQSTGKRVWLADLNSTLTQRDLSSDGVHPNNSGYVKLANLWFSALQPVLGAGREWPLFVEDFGAAAPPLTWTDTWPVRGRWFPRCLRLGPF